MYLSNCVIIRHIMNLYLKQYLRMKQSYTKVLLFIILTLSTLFIHGQNSTSEKVSNAFIKMDAEALTSLFNNQLDVVLLNREYNCTSVQALYILKKFFSDNPYYRFEIVHQGLNDQSTFIIAKYETTHSHYKIYILLKRIDNTFRVFQFRIESENITEIRLNNG